MLLNRRPAIIVAVVAASLTAVTPPVEAGWLCDWLCGRSAPVQPILPVAPVTAAPVAAACPPNYAAGYAPTTTTAPAQTSYYAPATNTVSAAPVTSYMPPVTAYSAAVNDSGAVAAQMPAYGAAQATLPTGYAGLYSSYYGAVPQQAVIAPAPVTSFYGTGNIYPDAQATAPGVVTANYAAASPPQAIINPQPHHGLLGGVGSFFRSLFGTNYQTSYYRAPVTYYRPVTTVSPTGATNTVQQPCTSYQNQVQRTPIQSYQGVPAASSTCGPAAPLPTTVAPTNGFQQVAPSPEGAEGFVPQPTLPSDSFDPYGSQRPSYGSYYDGTYSSSSPAESSVLDCPPANSAPLTGAPSNGDYNGSQPNGWQQNGNAVPADRQPVQQPQLDGAPSSSLRSYRQVPQGSTATSRSGWRQTAPVPAASETNRPPRRARPIPAPRSVWPTPNESSEEAGGRTAARDGWTTKKIQWASHTQPSRADERERPARMISEPSLNPPSQVRRANHTAEPAAPQRGDQGEGWQSAVPRRAVERSRQQPAANPRPDRDRYDDSGWE